MLPSLQRWLILPVEIKVRELDAKLWLACAALQRSYGVIIGSIGQVENYEESFPAGVYFAKDICPGRQAHLRQLKQHGQFVVCQDEETTVAAGSYAEFFDQRVSEASISLTQRFFAWGGGDKESLNTLYPCARDKVVATGSPRVDLWRPELRGFYAESAKALRDKYGPYILVASNFGANYIAPDEDMITVAQSIGALRDEQAVDGYRRYLAYVRELFEVFKEGPRALAEAFPEVRVIVRPHPLENPASWQQAMDGVPNAKVVFEGPITPWLLAAEAVLHNSCTSAVEAAILDRPVLSYRPLTSAEFDLELANTISRQAADLAGLLDAARAALGDPERFVAEQKERARPLLNQHLSALEGATAAEGILSQLEAVAWDEVTPSKPDLVPWRCTIRDGVHYRWRALKRRLRGDTVKRRWHKFPGLSRRELDEKLGRFAALQGIRQPFRSQRLSRDLFAVWAP